MDRQESRHVIKFLTLQGKTYNEVHDSMVDVYGDKAPSAATCFRWHREFERGRETVTDESRCGRPKSATDRLHIEIVKKILDEDRRQTVRQVANRAGISRMSAFRIIHDDLEMTRVCARFVPRFLTDQHRRRRVEASTRNLEKYDEERSKFFKGITTQDETWLHHYEPESKDQSSQWRTREEGAPIKFKAVASAGKVMSSVFWDSKGILIDDYLEDKNTVTGVYYAKEIEDLRESIKEKRRGKLTSGVLYLQDNAPAHTSHIATAAIRLAGFDLLDHPAYSPDLAPSDFHLFPKLKKDIRGKHYESNSEVISVVKDWYDRQSEEFWLEAFEKLIGRYEKCIELEGHYVEKHDNFCD